MNENCLEAALRYAAKGWPVFPITPRKKAPPLVKWSSEASCDAERIETWWHRWPDANVGIATGETSGLVVLDIDTGGEDARASLEDEHGQLPDTLEQHTGGGGRQRFYKHPGGRIPISAGVLGNNLDVRADGGYVVAPPSVHPSGNRYRWEGSSDPAVGQPAPLPDWLRVLMLAGTPGAEGGQSRKPRRFWKDFVLKGAAPGTRNSRCVQVTGHLRARNVDPWLVWELMHGWNERRPEPLPSDEVDEIVRKNYRQYGLKPRG